MFDGLINKSLRNGKGTFDDPVVLPAGPRGEPFTTIGGMHADLHEKYGFSNKMPLEQAKALVADAPAEWLANYSDDQLRRMAFNAEWMARMYVLGNDTKETPEQATKRFAMNSLERRYDATKPIGE